jgi:uncharacterized membrane protein (GlpM family)
MFLLALPKPPTFKKMRGIALDNVVKRKEEGVLRKDIFFHLVCHAILPYVAYLTIYYYSLTKIRPVVMNRFQSKH